MTSKLRLVPIPSKQRFAELVTANSRMEKGSASRWWIPFRNPFLHARFLTRYTCFKRERGPMASFETRKSYREADSFSLMAFPKQMTVPFKHSFSGLSQSG